MFNIYIVNYLSLSKENSEDLFSLRKNIFKDRLQWDVGCFDGKEFDSFDNEKTDYIFGIKNGVIICGTRIIDIKHHNMLNDTFSSFFKRVNLPEGKFIESTRFFVDKDRVSSLLGNRSSITLALFLSLINYAQRHHYDGILAVASHPMMSIIRKSGYLLLGHIDLTSQKELKDRILRKDNSQFENVLNEWPLSFIAEL
ncbi:acyl-homoserine-lactone synthase [Candidatus Symbiopectobacterium sp. NZEC135]|uniref:acyl-homoserine-lactone synthase n=1 Tax=Candidatus Symbiopectobacterium sp. NZEC135 TaxID=2820471 RepID=UPI002227B8E5|nr:acyl-homoserine-lactone synthase [Candidatus Symbiopectobacterium sp. NZEC135]MCW2481879.1 acyl-homoserine-lactone synthase [Candidatus Symbiopectobacterium sp. NZEC135]